MSWLWIQEETYLTIFPYSLCSTSRSSVRPSIYSILSPEKASGLSGQSGTWTFFLSCVSISRKLPVLLRLRYLHQNCTLSFFSEGEGDDALSQARKFTQVQRLVELHWLQGFPLWGCFTGLSDRQECKGPFGDYMYSVRQIVALYCIDHAAWKQHSLEYLCRYDMV